jgi:phage/plasmid-like protein (TIGR03299 family)
MNINEYRQLSAANNDLLEASSTSVHDIPEEILTPPEPQPEPQKRAARTAYGLPIDPSREEVEEILGWDVNAVALQTVDGQPVTTHVVNVTNGHQLGVVGASYQIIQNRELLDLADAIRNDNSLEFGTAGFTGDGQKVFFQCKGECFDIGEGDTVTPYMLFANGHDGGLAARLQPMTERMFCQNQLGSITRGKAYFTIRHVGNIKAKIEEAKALGRAFFKVTEDNRLAMLELRNTEVSQADLQKFFYEIYQRHYKSVNLNPKTEEEHNAAERARNAYHQFNRRFIKEKHIAGTTAWNMANAYTGWLQHDKGAGSNPQLTARRRYESSIIGTLERRSREAFKLALSS